MLNIHLICCIHVELLPALEIGSDRWVDVSVSADNFSEEEPEACLTWLNT